ncbi:PAS domain S-box protein [Nitrosomonas sp.]|uniref:hybrid sensor histidine kinase/response regulator n=1 Tax=Nitrosomonas sp. TaxID=42353 RepID=UPI0025E786FB|nr:PAS domain S-box protein [Nitrosomonas sp.]MBY0484364.1 PAS domain S-box protein [Nitrosomonas sp.]
MGILIDNRSHEALLAEIEALRLRLEKTEQMLQGYESVYRILIETMNEGAAILTKGGVILYCNDRLAKLLQVPLDQLIGSSFGAYVPPSDYPLITSLLENQTQGCDKQELSLISGVGKSIPVLFSCCTLGFSGNQRISVIITDITERNQGKMELLASEKGFRLLAEGMPQIVWVTRADGWNCYFNQQWVEYTGLTLEESYGHGWNKPFHPNDQQRAWDAWQNAVTNNDSYSLECRLRRADGIYRWWLIRGVPVLNNEGNIQNWFGTCTDIENIKQAETQIQIAAERERAAAALRESEALYRAIGESIDYGVWVCDSEGRNIYASPSFLKLVGLTQDQCSNFGWGNVLHPDDAESTLSAWQECIRTGGVWDIEHRFRGADGQWHPILARCVPVRDNNGNIKYWAGINLDITEQKKTEALLRESDRRKDEFLAMLGHELRNPLTPISNVAQVLSSFPFQESTLNWATETLNRNVTHITKLVDDLLDVSRITRGLVKIQRERVELVKLLKDLTESILPLIQTKHQTLNLELPTQPIYLQGDPIRLTQVFTNLLNNAIKYTDAGGCIDLSASVECSSIFVHVRDNGMGIEPQLLPHIFDLFIQETIGLDRSEGGLGLGLTLAKKLVELHGGQITAHSQGVNQGSQFLIQLPELVEETILTTPLIPRSSTKETEQGLRVLLIDDNEDVVESTALWFEMSGHQIAIARNGTQGISAAQTFEPDVILLDIGLPDIDGYQVARKLRKLPTTRRVLIIALSGYVLNKTLLGEVTDFDHYLLKPPDFNQLRHLLAEYERSNQSTRDLYS